MVYFCLFDGDMGEGDTLLSAYEELKDKSGYSPTVDDCDFYEASKIEVEHKIMKKEVVSKISKKKVEDED